MDHIDHIIFEQLTVDEQEKVLGGEYLVPVRPTGGCEPIVVICN